MMKKLFAVLAVFCLLCLPTISKAEPTQFSKDNLSVGIESALTTQKVDANVPLSAAINLGHFGASGQLNSEINSLRMMTNLVNVGYKLSDYITPYGLIGTAGIKYDYTLTGYASTWHKSDAWSGQLGLADYEFRGRGDQNIAYGFGATGKLLELPKGVLLSYDVRRLQFDANDKTETVIVPSEFGFPISSKINVDDVAIWSTSIMASKEFVLNEDTNQYKDCLRCRVWKAVQPKTITPMVGYKYSNLAMTVKNNLTIPLCESDSITASASEHYRGSMNTLLLGASAKFGDKKNVEVGVNGMLFGEQGVGAKVTYHF